MNRRKIIRNSWKHGFSLIDINLIQVPEEKKKSRYQADRNVAMEKRLSGKTISKACMVLKGTRV